MKFIKLKKPWSETKNNKTYANLIFDRYVLTLLASLFIKVVSKMFRFKQ